jgi:hypothetical protein
MGNLKKKEIEDKKKGNEIEILCQQCSGTRSHKVLKSHDIEWIEEWDEQYSVDGWDSYQIVQCGGCKKVTFRHLNYFSENHDYFDGSDGVTETLYPNRDTNTLPVKEFINAPLKTRNIYKETITSYNWNNFILAGAGVRAIVESICAEQKIIDGPIEKDGKISRSTTLVGKINGLKEKGIITAKNAEILHQHRFLGNESLHELKRPSAESLKLAIEIIEHVIEDLYEVPEKALQWSGATKPLF